jgi:predicted transcriptional regulator
MATTPQLAALTAREKLDTVGVLDRLFAATLDERDANHFFLTTEIATMCNLTVAGAARALNKLHDIGLVSRGEREVAVQSRDYPCYTERYRLALAWRLSRSALVSRLRNVEKAREPESYAGTDAFAPVGVEGRAR